MRSSNSRDSWVKIHRMRCGISCFVVEIGQGRVKDERVRLYSKDEARVKYWRVTVCWSPQEREQN